MIQELKKNLEQEKKIIDEMSFISEHSQNMPEDEKRFYLSSLVSLEKQLEILNNSIPSLLQATSLKPIKKSEKIVKLSYVSPSSKEKRFITINKADKQKFVRELSLSESSLSKLKKLQEKEKVIVKKPSQIAHISSLFFRRFAEKIAPKFSSVKNDLKQANIRFMISTYIAIALFFTTLTLIIGLIIFGVFLVLDFSYLIWFWVPFAVAVLCFTLFYLYPALEKGSVDRKLTSELPFATIYMAAIAGSNIEPTRIFKIIADSPDYPNIGYEIKKIINQIEIYGYDLVSVLRNAAKKTTNKRLSELFSGMATNIVSGGSLKSFLEQKADNLLVDYRLHRQKYSSVAETFMDIYISVLVTAPLVLMMLFIVINLTGFDIGLTLGPLVAIAIGFVVVVNIIFMVVLHLKQPGV